MDFKSWCQLCGALSSIHEIDIDILIIIENFFEVRHKIQQN